MRSAAPLGLLAASTLFLAVACSDSSQTGPANDDLMAAVNVPGSCDLLQDLARNTRGWFPQPEQRDASDLVRQIRDACSAGVQTTVTAVSWQVLGMIETLLETGYSGDASVGSSLANELLACTSSLCLTSALPGIDFTGAFGGTGLFAVRSGGMLPAIARAAVPFTDPGGNANTALWGVAVDQGWDVVTSANPVLVYGMPTTSGPVYQELNLGGLRYELNVFPDAGEFLDGALHVGLCFESTVELPIVAGADSEGRVQRNGVVLENWNPTFCPASGANLSTASLFAPVASVARALVPARFRALFMRGGVPVIGGTPLDFSIFAPVAANTAGTLEFVTPPPAVVVAGQPIGVIEVRARSGNGTPMERVKVTLSIKTNFGVPAGAEISGDLESYTGERAGEEGIATFPDDGTSVIVGKAGGYRVCADGELSGFTFTQVCYAINARNSN